MHSLAEAADAHKPAQAATGCSRRRRGPTDRDAGRRAAVLSRSWAVDPSSRRSRRCQPAAGVHQVTSKIVMTSSVEHMHNSEQVISASFLYHSHPGPHCRQAAIRRWQVGRVRSLPPLRGAAGR